MSRFFIVVMFIVLLYSCKPGVPSNVIVPSEMEKILYDIHVLDGYAITFDTASPDSLKKKMAPYYKGVYKKFKTDSAQYVLSLNYYYQHPKVLKEIYDHVSEKLLKARDKATKIANMPTVPSDNKPVADTAAKNPVAQQELVK